MKATLTYLTLVFAAGSAQAQQPASSVPPKPQQAAVTAPSGDAGRGHELFLRDGCWQCHGLSAQGANLSGPRLARTSLPFEGFVHQLRQPLNEMPPYETAVLPDAGAADIYAFLKSLPPPPKLEDVPLLMGEGMK